MGPRRESLPVRAVDGGRRRAMGGAGAVRHWTPASMERPTHGKTPEHPQIAESADHEGFRRFGRYPSAHRTGDLRAAAPADGGEDDRVQDARGSRPETRPDPSGRGEGVPVTASVLVVGELANGRLIGPTLEAISVAEKLTGSSASVVGFLAGSSAKAA